MGSTPILMPMIIKIAITGESELEKALLEEYAYYKAISSQGFDRFKAEGRLVLTAISDISTAMSFIERMKSLEQKIGQLNG